MQNVPWIIHRFIQRLVWFIQIESLLAGIQVKKKKKKKKTGVIWATMAGGTDPTTSIVSDWWLNWSVVTTAWNLHRFPPMMSVNLATSLVHSHQPIDTIQWLTKVALTMGRVLDLRPWFRFISRNIGTIQYWNPNLTKGPNLILNLLLGRWTFPYFMDWNQWDELIQVFF